MKTQRHTPKPWPTSEELRVAVREALYSRLPKPLARRVLPLLPAGWPYGEQVKRTRTIFIHVPKAAGSSIKKELYGTSAYDHRPIGDYYTADPELADAFFKFAFVRNPWERMLSAHAYLCQGVGTTRRDRAFVSRFLQDKKDFTDFVTAFENPRYRRAVMRFSHFRPQYIWICLPGESKPALDFLGRFETLNADLAEIRGRLGLPAGPTQHVRPSRHAPYREAYTETTRRIVADLYREDIATFGYTF